MDVNSENCDPHSRNETNVTSMNDTSNGGKVSDTINSEQTDQTSIPPDMATQILHAIQTQNEHFKNITKDLNDIKADIGHVKKKCEDIDERCSRLEKQHKDLNDTVTQNKQDISDLFEDGETKEKKLENMSTSVAVLEEQVINLNSEIDKLEEFSRRDNLRMFGIPYADRIENYDMCAKAVIDVLNSVDSPKQWTVDDIGRAHRVGQEREGQPKPMIVKFNRWKDKMRILTDRSYRDRLDKEKGIRVASDLTKRQADIVREARSEGKIAFFKNGKLTVGPPRPDPRTYAQAAATTVTTDRRNTPRTTHEHMTRTVDGRRDTSDTTRKDRGNECVDSMCDDANIGQTLNSPQSDNRGIPVGNSPRQNDIARAGQKCDKSVRGKPSSQAGLRGYFSASPTSRDQRDREKARPTDVNTARRSTRKTSQR